MVKCPCSSVDWKAENLSPEFDRRVTCAFFQQLSRILANDLPRNRTSPFRWVFGWRGRECCLPTRVQRKEKQSAAERNYPHAETSCNFSRCADYTGTHSSKNWFER
jgi:hypothetical protein